MSKAKQGILQNHQGLQKFTAAQDSGFTVDQQRKLWSGFQFNLPPRLSATQKMLNGNLSVKYAIESSRPLQVTGRKDNND